jgi:hypothetical protein
MRVRPKEVGVFHAAGFDIVIRLHHNQVWNCQKKTDNEYEIERDNVCIRVPKEVIDKLFKKVE